MMELNLSDLLDELQDDSVEIQNVTIASPRRVKELTMDKIERERKRPGPVRTISRVVLVAAVILLMATTVLAVSGFQFSDWINRETGEGFDHDVFYGSGSMFWEIGEEMFRVSVTEASPTGATVEWWNTGEKPEGKLTTDEKFWLEKWDGEQYVPLEPMMEKQWPEKTYEIPEGETPMLLELNWEDLYGELSTGYYRIGKTFTLTGNGERKSVDGYAKFRLFAEEMKPQLEKCREALNALLEKDAYHIRIRQYPGVHNSSGMFYDCLYSEIWKSGEDYLRQTKYILEADAGDEVVSSRGSMCRDGQGYKLEWENDAVTCPVSYWEQAGYVDDGYTYYTVWLVGLDWYESIVGEVYAEGNRVALVSHSSSSRYPYDEHILTFDDEGNLLLLEHYYLPDKYCEEDEKVFYGSMELLDTDGRKIARVLEDQDVSTPNTFSWAEDQAAWPDAQRDGFVNTQVREIQGMEDVVELALADSTMSEDMKMSGVKRYYNETKIFFDEDAEIWKVVFSFTQDTYFQAVYLNHEGITQMVVKGVMEE